jgi:hypothetical protein
MIDALSKTRSVLTTARDLTARGQASVSALRAGATLLGLLLAAMAFDIFFPLPGLLRGLFMLALVAWTAERALMLRKRLRTEELRLERAARLLEEHHPELENALINAVQFEAEVARRPDAPSARLMRREMERAEAAVGSVSVQDVVDSAAISSGRRLLLCIVAIAILSAVLFPRAWRFELPRFLLFWSDQPAFTLTDFTITPRGARVKAGGAVTVAVKVGGLIPDSVSLVTNSGRGPERTAPLFAAEDGVYIQELSGLTTDTWYYVRANTGRSQRFLIKVDQAPEARTVKVTVQPPGYAKRPPESHKLDDEGIKGLNGAAITLDVESSRPLSGAKLVLTYPDVPSETVTLTPIRGAADRATGTFTVRRSGEFRLELTADDGLTNRDAAHGKLTLLRDEKPIVYITAPGHNAVVTPGMQVGIRAEAEDDVALQRVEVHRIVNSMTDSAQSFAVPAGQRRADTELKLDFKDLGVRPGDVIQYYATAYDNDPGKPNLTDSERYWLWVVSEEDYQKLLQDQRKLPQLAEEYRQQTDALKSLAQEQRALADAMKKTAEEIARKPGDAALQQQMQNLKKQQASLRKAAEDLARNMRKLAAQKSQYDAEKGLQKKLAELAKQVEQSAAGAMKSAESAPSGQQMAQQGDQAAKQLEKASGQGQKSIEKALQALEKLAPLHQDIAHLRELARLQGELALQARQLARQVTQDAFQQSRLNELAQRQADLKQSLEMVQEDLKQHAADCQSVAPEAAQKAQKVAEALSQMKVGESMEGATSSFRNQDGSGGASQAERAQKALESLFQQGKGCQSSAKSGLDKELSLCLGSGSGNTLDQMGQTPLPGTSPGKGEGVAQGQGGMPAPQPGSKPGEGGQQGVSQQQQQAMLMRVMQQQSGRSTKRENRRHLAGADLPGELGKQDVEQLATGARTPPSVTDPSAGRYPAEYRRLVKDYFKAVAGGK